MPGVLEVVVVDLRSEIGLLEGEIDAGQDPSLRTARVVTLDTNPGWRELPRLFGILLRRPITALHVVVGALPASEHRLFGTPMRGDHVTRALGSVARPPQLEELWILAPGLGGGGLERLGMFASGLKRLGLRDNALTDTALQWLADSEGGASLEGLAFGGNRPTARGIRALANARLPALSHLGLWNCQLGVASVSRLVEGSLGSVTELSLASNPIGDDGVQVLAESAFSERLERLRLASCGIGDAGAKHLANSPSLRDVGLLDVRGNGFGERGQKLLLDRFGSRVLVGTRPEAP